MENKKDLFKDKVEISATTLIEIKRAFSVLLDDKESYLHKTFSDDSVGGALRELKQVYAEYFEEEVKPWTHKK
jgi:hypothetical protein